MAGTIIIHSSQSSEKTSGHILNTPKLAWKGYDIYGEIKKALNVPIGIDTDVNGSCLGEITYGASKGLTTVAYFTIGTGIGGGFAVNGQLVHGMMHPEAGHFLIQKNPNGEKSHAVNVIVNIDNKLNR